MLLDPIQVIGHVSVDPGLVPVTTAGAPADDSSQGELTLCNSFITYQRTPGVTLTGIGASLQEASTKHPRQDGVSVHVRAGAAIQGDEGYLCLLQKGGVFFSPLELMTPAGHLAEHCLRGWGRAAGQTHRLDMRRQDRAAVFPPPQAQQSSGCLE